MTSAVINTWLPRIISPNLGCPLILSQAEAQEGFEVIVALEPDRDLPTGETLEGLFHLRPVSIAPGSIGASGHGDGHGGPEWVALDLRSELREITDWDRIGALDRPDETRHLIPRSVHEEVFGQGTRYLSFTLGADVRLLSGDGPMALFDLVASDLEGRFERVCHHAVQVCSNTAGNLSFMHLTDLHVSRRNDEMLDDVLEQHHERSPEDIRRSYRNFNDHVRVLVREANRLASEGSLDFVVMTGDLVDFAHHGWAEGPCRDEVNWDVLFDILTGSDQERRRGNPGLQVACLTTLGNHDWRLHPYDPNMGDYHATFGLRKSEAASYPYHGYDPQIADRNAGQDLWANEMDRALFNERRRLWLARKLSRQGAEWVFRAIGSLVAVVASMVVSHRPSAIWLLSLTGGGVVYLGLRGIAYLVTRRMAPWLVDNPLHASASALYVYHRRFTPYFDLAFRFGRHWFVLLDSGPDVFTGQLFDRRERKQMKQMSLEDNILGGSPDSRGLESDRTWRDWSQVVWLDHVLTAAARDRGLTGRCFVCVHAPPVNTDRGRAALADLREDRRKGQGRSPWIPQDECNLTYGALGRNVSQFLYLCLGTRESETGPPNSVGSSGVDDAATGGTFGAATSGSLELAQVYENEAAVGGVSRSEATAEASGQTPVASSLDEARDSGSTSISDSSPSGSSWGVDGRFVASPLPVDLVLCGHAHRNVEFRLAMEPRDAIHIYTDDYASKLDVLVASSDLAAVGTWWDEHRPIVAQTGAVGPAGSDDHDTPYYRLVRVDEQGVISTFSVQHL
ncbi:MAG: metallophosphoesterase [Deltaproteobacteria bacterium]|nr:metallophosphoesterase [Deltaproteobacteria bacterium]